MTDLDSELESGQQSLDDILSKKQDNTLIPGTIPRPFSSQSYSSITTIDSQGVSWTCTFLRLHVRSHGNCSVVKGFVLINGRN